MSFQRCPSWGLPNPYKTAVEYVRQSSFENRSVRGVWYITWYTVYGIRLYGYTVSTRIPPSPCSRSRGCGTLRGMRYTVNGYTVSTRIPPSHCSLFSLLSSLSLSPVPLLRRQDAEQVGVEAAHGHAHGAVGAQQQHLPHPLHPRLGLGVEERARQIGPQVVQSLAHA